jgi:hypothetical protein
VVNRCGSVSLAGRVVLLGTDLDGQDTRVVRRNTTTPVRNIKAFRARRAGEVRMSRRTPAVDRDHTAVGAGGGCGGRPHPRN